MSDYLNSTTDAVWIPEVVAQEALGALSSYLNLGNTVARDSDVTPVRVGQTISIPQRGTITALQKSEGTDTTLSQPTGTEVTVTVDQHWYVTVGEEDYTNAFQQGSTLPGYMEDGMIKLAEKIEGTLVNLFSSFDNIDAATSAGGFQKGIIDARKVLVENKVPKNMPMYAYVSPRFIANLSKESAFLSPQVESNTRPLTEGAFGRLSGFDIFEGQLTPTSGSPAWDQNFFYTRDALILAMRPLRPGVTGVEATTVMSEAGVPLRVTRFYDARGMAEVIQLDVLWGVAVYDSRLGIVLESQDITS